MIVLLFLHLLLLAQSCGSFLSPAARLVPTPICGCNRRGKSSLSIVPLATAAKVAYFRGGALSATDEVEEDAHEPRADEIKISSILESYPRSAFSRVRTKPPNRVQTKADEEPSPQWQGHVLIQPSERHDSNEPGNEDYLPQQNDEVTCLEDPSPSPVDVGQLSDDKCSLLMPSNAVSPWICAGRVSGAHGLRGHLKINPTTFAKTERFCTRGG